MWSRKWVLLQKFSNLCHISWCVPSIFWFLAHFLFICIHPFFISSPLIINLDTYDILPNGPKAALTSSVVISGLRSPTKTWKWSVEGRGLAKFSFISSFVIYCDFLTKYADLYIYLLQEEEQKQRPSGKTTFQGSKLNDDINKNQMSRKSFRMIFNLSGSLAFLDFMKKTFPTYFCQYSSPLTTTCTYYLCLFSGWLALWPSWLWPPAERGKKEEARWGTFTSLWDHHYKGLSELKIWMKEDFKISWFGASSLIYILCLSSDTLRKKSLDINSKNRPRKHTASLNNC